MAALSKESVAAVLLAATSMCFKYFFWDTP